VKTVVNPRECSPKDFYKILIGSVLPRPIAWVSTRSKEGVDNLAPFSFFTVASANPPVLCFAPAIKSDREENRTAGVPKDTLVNVRETGEFVVNIVSRHLVEPMNQTSYDYEPNVSEFDEAGLTREPSILVKPMRVAESYINFECRLYQLIEIGKEPMGGTLVMGEILLAHLSEKVFKNGKIDMDALDPIGRLGGLWYSGIKDRFELPRPKAPKKAEKE
jgi:flavin reductase (DIM6/NTAB) family NADH-FMN oxidoreductase RutF